MKQKIYKIYKWKKFNKLFFRNIIKKPNILNIIYGNYYNIKNPKKLGNSYVFCYIKNWSLITIGPNCIIYKINLIQIFMEFLLCTSILFISILIIYFKKNFE